VAALAQVAAERPANSSGEIRWCGHRSGLTREGALRKAPAGGARPQGTSNPATREVLGAVNLNGSSDRVVCRKADTSAQRPSFDEDIREGCPSYCAARRRTSSSTARRNYVGVSADGKLEWVTTYYDPIVHFKLNGPAGGTGLSTSTPPSTTDRSGL